MLFRFFSILYKQKRNLCLEVTLLLFCIIVLIRNNIIFYPTAPKYNNTRWQHKFYGQNFKPFFSNVPYIKSLKNNYVYLYGFLKGPNKTELNIVRASNLKALPSQYNCSRNSLASTINKLIKMKSAHLSSAWPQYVVTCYVVREDPNWQVAVNWIPQDLDRSQDLTPAIGCCDNYFKAGVLLS